MYFRGGLKILVFGVCQLLSANFLVFIDDGDEGEVRGARVALSVINR